MQKPQDPDNYRDSGLELVGVEQPKTPSLRTAKKP